MPWTYTSKDHPCPVCGLPRPWCRYTIDGCWVLCFRVESDRPSRGKTAWLHKLRDYDAASLVASRTEERKRLPDAELAARFLPEALAASAGAGERVEQLADLLGVGSAALRSIGTGCKENGCGLVYTFPERNASGDVVGIAYRSVQGGRRRSAFGSRRALTYASGWEEERQGPLLVVEGATDVAAGLTMGLSVVGRPSASPSADLAVLLRGAPRRQIVVLAERDTKPEKVGRVLREYWPGLWGACITGRDLTKHLGRPVGVAMVPDGQKDMRSWLLANSGRDPGELGEEFVAKLEEAP